MIVHSFTDNVSDDALRQISSQLYALDVNGAYGRVQLDLQNRINSSGSGANRTDAALKPYGSSLSSYKLVIKLM